MDYRDFTRVCEEMQGSGQKITLRAVQSKIGGSFSTIGEYLRQWKQEAATPPQTRELSEALRRALADEIVQTEVRAITDAKESLERLETEVKELSGIVAEQEASIDSLKKELAKSFSECEEIKQEFQITQDRLSESLAREEKHKQDAANLTAKHQEFISSIAKKEQIIEGLEEDKSRMQVGIDSMQSEIHDLQNRKAESDLQRATAEGKLDAMRKLEDRIKDLEDELRQERSALKTERDARIQDLQRQASEDC